uniref:hypothetical protein n=2 Tax=Klebsiella pneumoniae TaxID=573 RepID=UPI0030EDCEC6
TTPPLPALSQSSPKIWFSTDWNEYQLSPVFHSFRHPMKQLLFAPPVRATPRSLAFIVQPNIMESIKFLTPSPFPDIEQKYAFTVPMYRAAPPEAQPTPIANR